MGNGYAKIVGEKKLMKWNDLPEYNLRFYMRQEIEKRMFQDMIDKLFEETAPSTKSTMPL